MIRISLGSWTHETTLDIGTSDYICFFADSRFSDFAENLSVFICWNMGFSHFHATDDDCFVCY